VSIDAFPAGPPAPVVVGVDGSPTSLAALEVAIAEAMTRGVPLMIVHAVEGGTCDDFVLAAAVATARRRCPGLALIPRSAVGDPSAVLRIEARDGCLLVIGHHDHCGHRAARTSSVAEHLAAGAMLPILVHRHPDPSDAGSRPILIGVSLRGADDAVLEFAFAAASRAGAPVQALQVWPDFGRVIPATAAADIAEVFGRWSDKYPDVPAQLTIRHGLDATIALTAASRSARLVVIGARAPFDEPLPATIATSGLTHGLIHRSGCPVAMVPAGLTKLERTGRS
jgi:nucleotide-binding universal stress UspA family protein